MSQLPTAHQLVLLLVKRDGLSYAEAAQAAGLSIHTIEKYVVEAQGQASNHSGGNAVSPRPMDAKTRQLESLHAQQASAWLETLRRPDAW